MPGQYFIYIPFNDAGLKTQAQNWAQMVLNTLTIENARALNVTTVTDAVIQAVKNDPNARKVPLVSMHGEPSSLGNLAHITSNDTVYVTAHGAANSTTISDNHGNDLTAQQLVDRMHADGVPSTVRFIKLWVCEGAQGTQSFAQAFYDATRKAPAKYPNAEVTGYTLSLKSFDPKSGHKVALEDPAWYEFWKSPKAVRPSSVAVHFPAR